MTVTVVLVSSEALRLGGSTIAVSFVSAFAEIYRILDGNVPHCPFVTMAPLLLDILCEETETEIHLWSSGSSSMGFFLSWAVFEMLTDCQLSQNHTVNVIFRSIPL